MSNAGSSSTPLLERLRLPLVVAILLAFQTSSSAQVTEPPSGDEIARRVAERPRPDHEIRRARLVLVDSRGHQRHRTIRGFRKRKEDALWIALFATAPPKMKHRAFLAYDYLDVARDDDQWRYLPARKRAQRLARKRRGDAFLGSDFSFEDMKKEDRVEPGEYVWKTLRRDRLQGRDVWVVERRPATPELERALGHARSESWIDASRWIPLRRELFAEDGAKIKTFEMRAFEEIDGMLMLGRVLAVDHETGSRSILVYDETDLETSIPDALFTTRTLEAERNDPLRSASD